MPSKATAILLTAVFLLFTSATDTRAEDRTYAGLRLGSSPEEVKDVFRRAGIRLQDSKPGVLSFTRPPVDIEGVKSGELWFRNKKLYLIALQFDHTFDWSKIESSYRQLKSRLAAKYGSPLWSDDEFSWLDSVRKKGKRLTSRWQQEEVTIGVFVSRADESSAWNLLLLYINEKLRAEKEEGL
jgi:hypothetical protein